MDVLLVEDNDLARNAVSRAISRTWTGARVRCATSLQDAMLALRGGDPDVVAVDLCLPPDPSQLLGLRVVEDMVRRGHDDRLIALTGLGEDAAQSARQAGARVVLQKPFRCAALRGAALELGLLTGSSGRRDPLSGRLDQMADVVERFGAKARPLVARLEAGDERGGRALGLVVVDLRARHAAYGTSLVARVADAAGTCKTVLYAWEQVARTWNGREFEALLRARGPHGERLLSSHIVLIATVRPKSARLTLELRALREGLTARAIARILRAP
jgi:CheY-like chemotaxis protein